MRPPKKYERGDMISTYAGFESAVQHGRLVFASYFFRGRPISAKVVENMSYRIVTGMILRGHMHRAVRSAEYKDWLRDELLGVDRVEWWDKRDPLLLSEEAS